jgi:hypothetical protein
MEPKRRHATSRRVREELEIVKLTAAAVEAREHA